MIKKLIGAGAGIVLLDSMLKNKTAIFTLHRVVHQKDFNSRSFQSSTVITENGLTTFIHWLKREFDVVPLSSLLNFASQSETYGRKPKAVITFDDGWSDNYDYAFPILKRENVPATIFLSVNQIGSTHGFWWHGIGTLFEDPELSPTCRQKILQHLSRTIPKSEIEFDIFSQIDAFIELLKQQYPNQAEQITHDLYDICGKTIPAIGLSWEQCEIMSENGIEFGSHTLSHSMLPSLNDDKLRRELCHSKNVLLEKRLNYVDAICYPFGGYDARTLRHAEQYYSVGLTTDMGIISRQIPGQMRLPRINISEKIGVSQFRAQYRMLKAAVKSKRKV